MVAISHQHIDVVLRRPIFLRRRRISRRERRVMGVLVKKRCLTSLTLLKRLRCDVGPNYCCLVSLLRVV